MVLQICILGKIDPIIATVKKQREQFQEVNFVHIKRDANQAAHWVARKSLKEMCPEGWVKKHPSSLVHILSRDGFPAPPFTYCH